MHLQSTAKKIIAVFSVILTVLSLWGCNEEYTEKTSFAMGSVFSARVFSRDTEKTEEILLLLDDAVKQSDKAFSNTDENAEIYKLNEFGILNASDYLKKSLSDTITVCNILERSVDISIGRVTALWGFNTDTPSLPDDKEIRESIKNCDIDKITVEAESSRISIDKAIAVDLGAVGKGLACDNALEKTRYYGIPYIVSFGGTVLAYGKGPQNGKWTVGIRNPFGNETDIIGKFTFEAESEKDYIIISTSGNYEKTFTENGKVYHHILDSATGYPVENDLVSVTVVSKSGLNADALSTAVFSRGLKEASLKWLKAFGSEAIFIFKDKTYYVTDGLKNSLKITEDGFSYKEYDEK